MSKSATSRPSKTLRQRSLSLLLNAAVVIVAVVAGSAFQARHMLAADRQLAPVLTAQTLAGDRYDLANVTAEATLVYFFAPWCTYCALSSDNLVRLRRLRDAQALEIVAVALDWQAVAEVQAYVTEHELNMPVLLGNREIMRDWQVRGFPTYYVLDSERRIVERDFGYSTQLGLWWRSWRVN